jgi:hypothetical protein
MACVLASVWLVAYPQGGRMDFGIELMQALSFLGTLLMSVVATACAITFVFRRAPLLAAMYSVSALCVVIGLVSLFTLSIPERGLGWRDLAEAPEFQLAAAVLPTLFIAGTTMALIPAVAALIARACRWRRLVSER